MIAVVGACTIHKFRVVFHESQGRVHLLIGQGPVTVLIVQVMTTTLQKNTQRLGLRFADQGRVVMSAPNFYSNVIFNSFVQDPISPPPKMGE